MSSDEEQVEDQECLQHEKRQKRLAQLVLARQKAAEVKKRRAAPKKELKRLEEEIKERLYQEDLQKVKNLRDLHANGPTHPKVHQKSDKPPTVYPRDIGSHLDDLVNILYS